MDRDKSGAPLLGRLGKHDICFALLLLAGLAFLLWRARYGYAHSDESFYLSVPYRLAQGDALLVHEWHPTQLSGLLLYPAMSIFLALHGSTQGIVLWFRYLYVAAQALAAVYIYIRLRRLSPGPALLASLIFLVYAPLNIATLSYNTMGLMLLSACLVTLTVSDGSGWDAVAAGLLFAGAVLCNPYLLLLYLLYSLLALGALCLKGLRRRLGDRCFLPGFWLRFSLGAALLAAVFLLFLLGRSSPGQVLESLPQLFMDSEHQGQGLAYTLFKYAEAIYANAWFNELSLGWLLLAVIMAADKNRLRRRALYLTGAALFTAAHYSYFVLRDLTVNYLMFPMNILGGFSCFLCREADRRPFRLIFIPGLLFSLCAHLASNLALMSIASAMSVCGLASAYYILAVAEELWRDARERLGPPRRLLAAALTGALLLQLCLLVYVRQRYVFWEDDRRTLDRVITVGPQAGVRTSAGRERHCLSLMEDTAVIRDADYDYVLYYSEDMWLYLMDDARMGAFSGWPSFLYPEAAARRMLEYWRLYPERVPQGVFVSRDLRDAETLVRDLNQYGWTVSQNASGYIMLK